MDSKLPNKICLISHAMNQRLLYLLAVALLSAHLGIFVGADSKELFENASPLQDVDSYINDVDTSDVMEKLKRSWKSLQGSWGKRLDEGQIVEDFDSQQPEWPSIEPNENNNEPVSRPETESEALKYYVLYAPNPNMLESTIGAASSTGNFKDLVDMKPSDSNFEKKSWKNMNVAWGKRRSAVWNKFRGAWGKREPAWNNLKGMWGKRSTKDWKKLQSAWGKRSQQH